MNNSNTATPKSFDRVFSGVQPSGAQVHIGNYLGAMKRFVSLSAEYETIICVVDLHALTSVEEAEKLSDYTLSLAASYLAIGLDPKRTVIFRQSDVPAVCELAWYLACHFPLGLLERAHKLKDIRAKNIVSNSGLMFYPILMAADILLYNANKVPVGADQKQHLEMSREVAQRFNHFAGKDVFRVPDPLIEEATGVIPGLDGRKMSKSYDNYIGLFEEPKELKTKVMRIVTDSKTVEEAKDPDSCNVFNLFKHFGTKEEIQSLRERYQAGGLGYGHAKQELLAAIEREIHPLRERYKELIARPHDIKDLLADGAQRAKLVANETMARVRDVLGVGPILG